MRRFFAIALLATLALGAACPLRAETVTLAYKFRAGEIDKYKLHVKLDLNIAGLPQTVGLSGPMSVDVSMVMRQKTLGIYPDGSAKVLISCGEPKISMPNMPPIPKSKQPFKSPEITMVLGPDGGLRKIEGLEKALAFSGAKDMDLSALRMSRLMNFMGQNTVFPSQPLEVGQMWDTSIPLPFGNTEIKISSVLITDNAAVGKSKAAHIQQAMEGSLDLSELFRSIAEMVPAEGQAREMMSGITGGMEMFGSMDYFFSTSAGKLLRGAGDIVANLTVAMPQQVVKMGGPPRIDVTANMACTITKIQ